MKIIKVLVEIDIFDDPEFCNDRGGECEKLFRGQCNHFFRNLKHRFPPPGEIDKYRKCDQCNAAYQKAKSIEAQVKMLKESPLDPMHPERNL